MYQAGNTPTQGVRYVCVVRQRCYFTSSGEIQSYDPLSKSTCRLRLEPVDGTFKSSGGGGSGGRGLNVLDPVGVVYHRRSHHLIFSCHFTHAIYAVDLNKRKPVSNPAVKLSANPNEEFEPALRVFRLAGGDEKTGLAKDVVDTATQKSARFRWPGVLALREGKTVDRLFVGEFGGNFIRCVVLPAHILPDRSPRPPPPPPSALAAPATATPAPPAPTPPADTATAKK